MIFISKLSSAVAFLLLLSFILQPIERVQAAEESQPVNEVVESDAAAPVPNGSPSTESEHPVVVTEPAVELQNDAPVVTEEELVVPVVDSTLPPSEPILPPSPMSDQAFSSTSAPGVLPDMTVDAKADEMSDTEVVPVESEVSVEPAVSTSTEIFEVTSDLPIDEKEEVIIDALPEVVTAEERAALSFPQAATTTTAMSSFVQTDENFYQFSRNSCVKASSGTFHCSDTTASVTDSPTAVSAAIGASGSQEIFMHTSSGASKQLTDNQYDDTAPQYDPDSERIAWQRLIDGRQQIVLYSLADDQETQLTTSNANNMEPALGGSYVVWQTWDNDDWEIMLFDGEHTIQITDNDAEDVTPVTKDGYVMWTVIGQAEQLARVYSIETGETYTISDHEGGAIVNPRFVLVYDTKFDNGDVTTHGFDPLTGLSSPITATPAPIEIPDSDSTGETRALIQIKSQLREDAENEDGVRSNPVTGFGTSTDPVLEVASTTLDLQSAQLDAVSDQASAQAVTSDVIPLSDYDLVVLPFDSSVASSTQP